MCTRTLLPPPSPCRGNPILLCFLPVSFIPHTCPLVRGLKTTVAAAADVRGGPLCSPQPKHIYANGLCVVFGGRAGIFGSEKSLRRISTFPLIVRTERLLFRRSHLRVRNLLHTHTHSDVSYSSKVLRSVWSRNH